LNYINSIKEKKGIISKFYNFATTYNPIIKKRIKERLGISSTSNENNDKILSFEEIIIKKG